jgi:hypothetical protein
VDGGVDLLVPETFFVEELLVVILATVVKICLLEVPELELELPPSVLGAGVT